MGFCVIYGHCVVKNIVVGMIAVVCASSVFAQRPAIMSQIAHDNVAVVTAIRDIRLAMALSLLCNATRTHHPFVREFELVRQIGGTEGRLRIPLDSLASHATIGVATVGQLRDSFGMILLPKLMAVAEQTAGGSWIGDFWSAFVGTVLPKPLTDDTTPPTNPMLALVKTSMDRLSEDDLVGALNHINKLDGAGADLVARWTNEANARIVVDDAYENMLSIMVDLLARNPIL